MQKTTLLALVKRVRMSRIVPFENPVRLVLLVALSIFSVEFAVMNLLHRFRPFPPQIEALADAVLLVLLLLPVLYFFFLRPLLLSIERRRCIEERLVSERNRLETVTENIGAGLTIISRDYETLWTNGVLERMFGDVIGRSCFEAFNRKAAVCPDCGVRDVFEKGLDRVVHEQKGFDVRGDAVWSEIIATPIRNADGQIIAALELVVPVTERKRVEIALERERYKFMNILDSMRDGVYIVNRRHEIEYVNPVIEREFGPVNGRLCYDYFHGRNEACPWCTHREVFAGKSIQWEWYCARNGRIYDLFDTPLLNADGTMSKLEIFHDITTRKQIETSLRESEEQLRALSARLMIAQESERERIARELHDDLGQSLTLLKFRLRHLKECGAADHASHLKECESAIRFVEGIIESVRRLSRDLSPAVLDDLGLTGALKWLIEDFTIYTPGIAVTSAIEPIDDLFPREEQVVLYRMFQEALTNIQKHAGAQHVTVEVRNRADAASFAVQDDGRGFDSDSGLNGRRHGTGMGLAGMQQRIRILGGTFKSTAEKGKGTRIEFSVPARLRENAHGIQDRSRG